MNNSIITMEKANEEKLNSYNFSVNTIKEYMAFYMLLLQVACEIGMFSEQEKERINKFLLLAIAGKTEGRAILMANIIYVYTFWLLSKKPSEAVTELLSIVSKEKAEESLEKSKKHLNSFISKNKILLTSIKAKVIKTENHSLITTYNSLCEFVNELSLYDTNEDLNLKSLHSRSIPFVYIALKECEKHNYFQQLGDIIFIFWTEMNIMFKINGEAFYKRLNEQAERVEEKSNQSHLALEQEYKRKLANLKAKYELLEKEARERLKNPTNNHVFLTPEEYRAQYEHEKSILMKAWNKAEATLTKKQEKESTLFFESIISTEMDIPGLYWLIREFALYSQAMQGLRKYPKRPKDRAKAIDQMSTADAIREVLKYKDSILLNESEERYLTSLI